jgi:hypothetical protein
VIGAIKTTTPAMKMLILLRIVNRLSLFIRYNQMRTRGIKSNKLARVITESPHNNPLKKMYLKLFASKYFSRKKIINKLRKLISEALRITLSKNTSISYTEAKNTASNASLTPYTLTAI